MAGSVNKVTLIGNLARDPEIRSFNNGGKVANMRLITSESWNDKQSGERRERSEGHNIAVFNERLVEVVEKYCKKGDKLYIEGQLTTRKYQDKNGNDAYATEIVLQQYRGELQMLGSAGGDGHYDQTAGGQGDERGSRGGSDDNRGGGRNERGGGNRSGERNMGGFADDLDDDVPF